MPTPAHIHGEAEEIFYVLGGSGLTWLDEKAYEIREGDCIVYKNWHEAHTIRASDDGLDVLAFGGREYLPMRRAAARAQRVVDHRLPRGQGRASLGPRARARLAGPRTGTTRRRS